MNAINPNVKKYDLKDRTCIFAKKLILFSKILEVNSTSKPIISQLIRAGTSIGANYMEADGAESKKDFIHKIAISKKEAKETRYWLDIILNTIKVTDQEMLHWLLQEATELTLIFSSIINSSKKHFQ